MSHELNLRMVEARGMQMEHTHGGQNYGSGQQYPGREEHGILGGRQGMGSLTEY